jgi:hypothetical protein
MKATSPAAHVIPGQMFVYRENSRLWRAQSGAGQVLGEDDTGSVVFVRVFNVSGDELRTLIGFIPLLRSAYEGSQPEIIKRLDLPEGWEALRSEWAAKRRIGEAGVFSGSLREVTGKVLETVNHLREVSDTKAVVIDLAYPTKSASGRYDTIAAFVRTAAGGVWR